MPIRKLLLQSLQVLASLWALILIFCLCIQGHHFLKNGLDYDLAHVYPDYWVDDARNAAKENLSEIANYRTIVMVGFPASQARHFDRYIADIKTQWQVPDNLKPVQWNALDINEYFAFYRLISNRLMNLVDQHTITKLSDEELLARSVESLTAVGQPTFIAKADDPLGFFARWAQKRMPKSTILPRGDTLKLYAEDMVWGIFIFQAQADRSQLNPYKLTRSIESLREIVRQMDPQAQVLVHGRPFESAVAAQEQISELIAILCFHLLLIGALVWLWSRSSKMAWLTVLCVTSSYVFSLAVIIVMFQKLTLWTLVAGSAITGLNVGFVAFYLFAQRLYPHESPLDILDRILSRLLWILGIAFLSCSLLYLIPVPTIKQLSVFFCSSAISGAVTLILFFPLLTDQPLEHTDFSRRMEMYCRYFPRFSFTHWQTKPSDYTASLTVLLICTLIGFIQIRFDQSIEDFISIPDSVTTQEAHVDSLLTLPSNTKFFLITTPTVQETLMAEEALRLAFVQRGLTDDGMTTTCLSKWFPSIERQHHIEALRHVMFEKVRQPLSSILGYPLKEPDPVQLDITFEQWLNSPTASPIKYLWLNLPQGTGSIIQIAGIDDEGIVKLQELSYLIAGASYVDTIKDTNQLLDQYRYIYVGIFALFVVCSLTISLFHYGFRSWRVVVPPLVGIALAISLLAWFGLPFTVFGALSMVVSYGFGIGLSLIYFATENNETKFSLTTFTFLAMAISFGIIGLSATPAIKQFGLTGAVTLTLTGICLLLIRPKMVKPEH